MSNFVFGVGVLNAKQTRDDRGRVIPEDDREYIAIDRVRSLSFEIGGDLKTLQGNRNFPEAVVMGSKTLSGTITLYGDDLNFRALIEGKTLKNGANGISWKRNVYVIPAGGSVTITPEDSGTFKEVVSVVYEATHKKLKKVASAPAVGEYSVTSAGVFTFNVADEGVGVYISYKYSTAIGKQLVVKNMEMGESTQCVLEMFFPKQSKLVTLYNVVFGGISADYTSDDFASYSVTFSCSADELDNVYSIEDLNAED